MITITKAASILHLEIENDHLFARWPDDINIESREFYQSMRALFNIIRNKGITKVILDFGEPRGGILSERAISYALLVMPFTNLRKIAILESTDFHWDNNLLQLINYFKTTLQFPIEARLFQARALALAWFNNQYKPLLSNLIDL